jgi:hypothetical protein
VSAHNAKHEGAQAKSLVLSMPVRRASAQLQTPSLADVSGASWVSSAMIFALCGIAGIAALDR